MHYQRLFKVGPYMVKFQPWNNEAFHREQQVPSYGGWIKMRNLPMDGPLNPLNTLVINVVASWK